MAADLATRDTYYRFLCRSSATCRGFDVVLRAGAVDASRCDCAADARRRAIEPPSASSMNCGRCQVSQSSCAVLGSGSSGPADAGGAGEMIRGRDFALDAGDGKKSSDGLGGMR